MSRGHQRVIATGHLGDHPVIKAPQAGGLIAEFRIAVTDTFKDREGNRVEHTEWLRIKAFGRTAEIAQQYLAKGRLVTVEGKIRTEKWRATDGSDRYSQWIYIDNPRGLTLHGGNDHDQTRREHQGRPAEPTPAKTTQHSAEDAADDEYPF